MTTWPASAPTARTKTKRIRRNAGSEHKKTAGTEPLVVRSEHKEGSVSAVSIACKAKGALQLYLLDLDVSVWHENRGALEELCGVFSRQEVSRAVLAEARVNLAVAHEVVLK